MGGNNADSMNIISNLKGEKKWKVLLSQGVLGEAFFLMTFDGKMRELQIDGLVKNNTVNAYPSVCSSTNKLYYYEDNLDRLRKNKIIEIDLKRKNRKELLDVTDVTNLSASLDGKNISFLGNYGERQGLFILELNELRVKLADDSVESQCKPSWSSDSKAVVYCSPDGYINMMSVETLRKTRLIRGRSPSWIPNTDIVSYRKGEKVVRQVEGGTRIEEQGTDYYVYDIKTKRRNFLFDGEKKINVFGKVCGMVADLVWSPDGRYCLFYHIGTTFFDFTRRNVVYVFDRESKDIAKVATIRGPIIGITWGIF